MGATVALVGRPNVGKSTLFNRLTRSRDALVANVPGLTRDRRYGRIELDEHIVTLVDTGGIFGEHELADVLTNQTQQALTDADLALLMLDGRAGITAADQDVVTYLRQNNIPFLPVVNKIDGVAEDQIVADVAVFGFAEHVMISATHSRGLRTLRDKLLARLEGLFVDLAQPADAKSDAAAGIHVAVVGRPNVGKSTLVNRLLGEERQVVFDMPGTTKDAIDIPFTKDGQDYVLIDTAGVRRKGKVDEITEKFSVVKALQAMERAAVVILVLDGSEGIVEQDLHVLQYALEAGAGMVVAVNKWDGLETERRERVKTVLNRRLNFIPWVPLQTISALHGSGVGNLLKRVKRVYDVGRFDYSTSLLTRLVRNMVAAHPAPSVRGRPIKVKVATRAGGHPPRIVVHGNQLNAMPASYRRYLENGFREALDLIGNPVRLELRESENPYAGKSNVLTKRQVDRRKRLIQNRKDRQKRKRR
ncbi:MAG TPA: ribosome biogenesis GTPase Der [Gammaproteobacteria bacterium]|nr:ribosome biogenesis GTPase Der [Gammaproteobacteria bacterium]|tara:strand:- start:3840 stop:5264 length:1425 start_codon:yes stop_codon:yes gene_type:complete